MEHVDDDSELEDLLSQLEDEVQTDVNTRYAKPNTDVVDYRSLSTDQSVYVEKTDVNTRYAKPNTDVVDSRSLITDQSVNVEKPLSRSSNALHQQKHDEEKNSGNRKLQHSEESRSKGTSNDTSKEKDQLNGMSSSAMSKDLSNAKVQETMASTATLQQAMASTDIEKAKPRRKSSADLSSSPPSPSAGACSCFCFGSPRKTHKSRQGLGSSGNHKKAVEDHDLDAETLNEDAERVLDVGMFDAKKTEKEFRRVSKKEKQLTLEAQKLLEQVSSTSARFSA